MLVINHTTPGRLLGHLGKLQRDDEALLALPRLLTVLEEARWEVRVWRCLDKIADPRAFESAMQRDLDDMGGIDLDRLRSAGELNDLLRRRITRRLGTLASVIEKVEAHAESPPQPPDKAS